MSYSPLVTYFNQSPNYESRNGNKIQGFAIHCFVGQVGMPRGVDVFKPTTKDASANYVIAYDGEIGAALQDEHRSWCTSSRIDEKVISIECASDSTPPYAITDACYHSLIRLLVDRCKAYDIHKLSFANDDAYGRALKLNEDYQNIVVHRWYANKACPGQYIMDLLTSGKICNEVNAILSGSEPEPPAPTPEPPAPEPEYDWCKAELRILGIGDEGNDVANLQACLEREGYDLSDYGGADGIFGEGTEYAVKAYQRDHDLAVDGEVGTQTWESLFRVKF